MLEIVRKYNFWNNEEITFGFYRKEYITTLSKYMGNRLIKVLLGQRRSGKSYILRMIIHALVKQGIKPKNILYINKDIRELDFINSADSLLDIISIYRKELQPEGKVFLFLDEIQEIDEWEKAVNSLSQNYIDEYEIFITGSNSRLLSTDLATYIAGRYVTFEIFPFSYTEYLGFKQIKRSKASFVEYIQHGGIPEHCKMADGEIQRNYISGLKDSIVLRDIVERHEIRDVYLLENLIRYMIDSVGSLFSLTSVVNYMKSNGYSATRETLGSYLLFLEQAYFLHEVSRFSIRGKKVLTGEKKYYLNDPAFKFFLSSSFDPVPGKYLENAIFLHLKRQGYSIFVGKHDKREIDFIAEKEKERVYIQVAQYLTEKETIEREFGNLQKIKNSYPKLVITLDDILLGNREGVEHIQAWEWVE
ncbi:ATP-binding protein [bacterium]|nr:ATP-binding protein [bacterium]